MADVKVLAEELVNLTVKEVNELATILKEEYGIEPAAAAVAVAAPAAAGEAAVAEKTTFDVVLKSAGQAKLQVIKAVKEAAGLSLGDAKALVDAAPKAVRRVFLRRRLRLSRLLSRRQVQRLSLSNSLLGLSKPISGVELTTAVEALCLFLVLKSVFAQYKILRLQLK